MRRLPILLLACLTSIALIAAPAGAAEVDEAAAAVSSDGFFVEQGASISAEQAGALVAEMRNIGEGFSLVVLSEEPLAGATTFADNVQRTVGTGLIFVIAPDSLGYAGVGDVFNEVELENALEKAFEVVGTDFELAAAFVGELTGVPSGATSEPVTASTTAAPTGQGASDPAGSSGGGSGWLWFVVIVGALGLFLWWMMRRTKAKQQDVDDERLSKARYLIQEQLNDLANDILAMEDEVRVADNDRASRFYEQASETYNSVSENVEKTTSAQGLVDLSNKLDVAIWQLDSAEAILDDKPLPDRPEPKRLEPATPAERPAPPPAPGQAIPGPSTYERRPQRKSSIGGGNLMDLLIVVGGGLLNSRRRGSGRSGGGGLGGGLGDLFGRRSGSTRQQPRTPAPPPQSSSGPQSNPVPGPGRPATPSRTGTSMPKSSRRGTSGRVRSGRRRRKG